MNGPRSVYHRVLGNYLNTYTGSDWTGINFLYSSSYGDVFWICDQNSGDNAAVF